MRIKPLRDVEDEAAFGGKAVSLGTALRAGLNVPAGLALEVDFVTSLADDSGWGNEGVSDLRGSLNVSSLYQDIINCLGDFSFAVRSSAVGEDSEGISFAGQHATRLNVRGPVALMEAIREVWVSAHSESAAAYRRKLGVGGEPRMAVIIQRLVAPVTSGVLFTINPITGADERVVEATWGLGEAVVSGLVTPDSWRLHRGGACIEHKMGEKDMEIVALDTGTAERPVEKDRAHRSCLETAQLAELENLAGKCEAFFESPNDIEWCFTRDDLFLLQRRPVTR